MPLTLDSVKDRESRTKAEELNTSLSQEFLSMREIVKLHGNRIGVYMIRPGGPKPCCQPKSVQN